MSDKPEQQKQPFTEQDGLFAAELVTPAAPVAMMSRPSTPTTTYPLPRTTITPLPWTPQ